MELAGLRERLAALDMDAELARADVAGWRDVTANATFFRPLPLVAQAEPSCEGGRRDPAEHTFFPERLALDGRGRPVALVQDWMGERPRMVWHYGDGWLEQLDARGEVLRATLEGDRVVRVAAVSRYEARSEEITWEDGVAVRADGVRRPGEQRFVRLATVAGGRVEQVRVDGVLVWDGRVSRSEPWPDDPDALVEPLARALDGALRAAARASGVAEPFCLEVRPGTPAWPPFARLGSRAFRDRMRASSRADAAAVSELYQGEEHGEVAHLTLVDDLDAEALRACRVLSTALGPGSSYDPDAMRVADAVGDRLAARLCATPLTGAAEPFLALVYTGRSEERFALERARRVAGDARVDAFLASVASTARRAGPPSARVLTDRRALEQLLAERGLEAHARRLAHDVAQEGLVLVRGDGPSHLGGPPVLPPDTAWPRTGDGAALTLLAAIRLADTALADPGWLLFYAALDPDEDRLIDDTPNAPGAPARVLYAAEPVPADGPALAPRPLALLLRLTLPDGWEAADELGLDVYEGQAYRELLAALVELRRAETGTLDAHWFGGLTTGVQGSTPEPGTRLLLHIGWDEDLGFELADGGVVQFRIPTDALAARDWARVVAYPDSS